MSNANVSLLEKSSATNDNNSDIPLDIVKLPSKGLLYAEEHPFHNVESVEFKAMGAFEENILASTALIKKGTAINTLIKSCLMNKLVDPSSLIVGDKSAILLAIRISGYGPEYKAKTNCPECNKQFKHVFNLGNVQYKFLGKEPVNPGSNLFSFILPGTKRQVTFKLLTDGDDVDVAKTQENRKKTSNVEVDTTITDRLLSQIVSIGTITEKDAIAREIRKMSLKDSRPLREFIHSIEPDLVFEEEVECKFCGAKEAHPIPLGVEFLWPKLNSK